MKNKNLSIRARVAYGALCLESLLVCQKCDLSEWKPLMNRIWEYTSGSPGEWHYPMAECTPRSVEEDVPFFLKGCDTLSREEHDVLKELYGRTPESIKGIINLIFEVGTKDLYSSITAKSPETLQMLQRIIELLTTCDCSLPDDSSLLQYTIEECNGWGKPFVRDKDSQEIKFLEL